MSDIGTEISRYKDWKKISLNRMAGEAKELIPEGYIAAYKVLSGRKVVHSGYIIHHAENHIYITDNWFERCIRYNSIYKTELLLEDVCEITSFACNIASTEGLSLYIARDNMELICDTKRIETGVYKNTKVPSIKNEIGTELELEGTGNNWQYPQRNKARVYRKMYKHDLVYDVGTDGSVSYYGTEIRFEHPELKKWTKPKISKILTDLSELGFKQGVSAGQHVHISHPNVRKAIQRFALGVSPMNELLLPVSGRHKTSISGYGVGIDIMRNQYSDFKTLEIRVFESTINPDVFQARLRLCKNLVDYLVAEKKVADIWKKMPVSMLKDYVFLLYTENPHTIGMSIDEVMEKLGTRGKNMAIKLGFVKGE